MLPRIVHEQRKHMYGMGCPKGDEIVLRTASNKSKNLELSR